MSFRVYEEANDVKHATTRSRGQIRTEDILVYSVRRIATKSKISAILVWPNVDPPASQQSEGLT